MNDTEALIRSTWEQIKENIREENDITDIAYNIWVKPLQFYSCEGNIFTILIPDTNTGMLDYISKNYTNCFQDALYSLLSEKYEVVFILKTKDTENTGISDKESDSISSGYYTHDEDEVNESNLNPKYRFENFVVGSNNNLAHSASLHVAESPGKEFNPLFIYGGSGLGKTHLMTSIGHYIIEHSNMKVLYVTSEQFTNEVIESIRFGQTGSAGSTAMTKFREKYRNIDVLLIDDIQFIIGKPSTQEEFFHTFNALLNSGKSIVITSDKHPSLMKELDERYRSRFSSGLCVDIQPPIYETRMAILQKYAGSLNIKVSNDIIDYIAKNIKSNVRELEGAFNQIYAKSKLDGDECEMTLENAMDILKDTISPNRPAVVTAPLILEEVAKYYGISPEDITSKKRNAEIVLPRQIFMYLCREMTDITLKGIAALLDKKDHSTVLHGYNKISDEIKTNSELRETIDLIINNIKSS